jgi:hypothetical protein
MNHYLLFFGGLMIGMFIGALVSAHFTKLEQLEKIAQRQRAEEDGFHLSDVQVAQISEMMRQYDQEKLGDGWKKFNEPGQVTTEKPINS